VSLEHFILTRFNLPTGGVEARIRASETWLSNRWRLFEQYCVPSVASQTVTAFRWVIYFDPVSPAWLKEAIAPYVAKGLFTAVFRTEVPTAILVSDLRGLAQSDDGVLLTTNLDNDDGVAIDFVERLQSAVTFEDRRALYVTNGLIKSSTGVYLRRDPENAFCSVAEPWSDARTSWSDWHIMLSRTMPVIELDGAPGWLQVVHGENVSNRVRGRLVAPDAWNATFPGLLDDVTDPGLLRLLSDRFLLVPLRGVRDSTRTVLRRIALAVLGKDGMLQMKARLKR